MMQSTSLRGIERVRGCLLFYTLICGCVLCASDADIQALVDQVSQTKFTAHQQAIESMGLGKYGGELYNQNSRGRAASGNLGDKGNQEARQYIGDQFLRLGLQAAVQGKYLNIVAEQTGAKNPLNIIIVAAHYDTKKSTTPGGDGDASGVAGVLEAARVLSQYKFDNTIRYVLFNASEKNFRGSNDYALKFPGAVLQKFVGLVELNAILHPAHDKNPQIAPALAANLGAKESAATDWSDAFLAASKQFVPALPIDPTSPRVEVLGDHYSFVLNGYVAALKLSENAGKDQANSTIGTIDDASDGPAGNDYDYAFATNVVRATVAMIAQQAGYNGPADVAAPSDSDGDGFSDETENALGTDPNSAASTPLNLPPATQAGALDTTSMVIGLDFQEAGFDAIATNGALPIPVGFQPKGSVVVINIAGVVKALTLNAAGTGTKGNDTFSLKAKFKKGVAETAQLAPFTLNFTKGNFKKQFAIFGLLNTSHQAKPVTVPLTIIFNNQIHITARALSYTSAKNTAGSAR